MSLAVYRPTPDMDPTLLAGDRDSALSPFVVPFVHLSEDGLARLSTTLGFSASSFRKLDRRRRVRSATDGGFSGRGGAGPREPVVAGTGAGLTVVVVAMWISLIKLSNEDTCTHDTQY